MYAIEVRNESFLVPEFMALLRKHISDDKQFEKAVERVRANVATTYILGMAKIKGKVKILLDINEVLTSQEIHRLEAALP